MRTHTEAIQVAVGAIMTPGPDTSSFPVVDGGELIGILTSSDVIKHALERI